ncbi:division/cell wall cluster transcriptional repressor MraZ [Candidatus Roizmanbacteria bacterium CG_4_10_14_0_8_um_filter_33_9]|uniref:Transcriptional regulator MraZ n=1 Tax=Candidatus Roizmanbacteria bacterium CG_4_10_14_0_8_um_filter_33_9 TaxID=1974826 RepID=A0A2M7QJ27_9BACT|nr:MAG: division/cell wall cluster transcriptional repressor MraZ [Candidatus Roizmanbacteria bacterium CG_4_10_14_0_8_um_filter_33_9]
MVFFGEYQLSFSAPGRVVLPKKLRELLKGNMFVITKGFDSCLAGYDKDDWENRAKSLLDVSLLEKEQIEKRRFLFSSTMYLEIDDQGRFVLPRTLLAYANLSEKVIIVGIGDHFEIWNPEKWSKYLKDIKN